MARFLIRWRLEKKPNRDRPDTTLERERIVVGSRPLADVYVQDRLVPQEAFELTFDGRRLELDVKGRLAGVFVGGLPVEGRGAVPHGAAIQCGHCLIEVAIDAEQQVCTLTVGEKYLTATVAALSKKAAQPCALEDAGPQEHRWGKSSVLPTWTWIAAFAGVLLLAAFPFTRDTAVVDRGPLASAHAIGAPDGPRSCADCHEPFASDYGPKCAKCHEGYDAPAHHPYDAAADIPCSDCHFEHRGEGARLLPPMDAAASGWPRTCDTCHAKHDREALIAQAVAAPDLAAKVRDREAEPAGRPLRIDGFSHADHRVAKTARASLAGAAASLPPSGDVPVPCGKCHAQRAGPDVPGASPAAEFALVAYETCLSCHADWKVPVHGRDGGGAHCLQCHADPGTPVAGASDEALKPIRTVAVVARRGEWQVPSRRHDLAKDDCRACHVAARQTVPAGATRHAKFRHEHHVRTVTPEKGGELALAAACVACHEQVAGADTLRGLGETLPVAKLDGCGACHTDGAPTPVPVPDDAAPRTVVDMFHSVHTVEPGTVGALRALAGRESLSRGCLSCHVPVAGDAPMELRDGVKDCTACHAGHESLGGGKCALCHVDRAAPQNRDARGRLLFRRNEMGVFAPSKAVVKTTRPVKAFDHFSSGHAAATAKDCAACHDAAAVDRAERVLDVAWPGAVDRACLECHVRDRFHR